MKKVLLINTHLTYQGWSEGTLNNSFVQKAKDFFTTKGLEVLETQIENGYNADEEVEKHLQADIIILQTPVNWFGAPWIYKKYIDEVFNSGLNSQKFLSGDGRTRENLTKQYGTGGKMQGKKFMICATFNAPAESFNNPLQSLMQGKGTEDLFLNITSNYRFCGVEILQGYNCFDIFKDGDIAKDIEDYPKHLEKIVGEER
ncbi:modulator of drug activity B [Flavobacterium araucananum]|uniref:Flavodoxin n=1 Tax=Flavobacterium araucananum TaxID=946678 RepID=A0A227NLF5_9FLAO|nr:NAD(P)H-dependent oxidoreductase [Flavobacterium araucananum]OXE98670.1 flavodoxin [Flavobacterium araucananum]PWJ97249.1 modulator of drug activity B [Flavobacterium araucananum]